MGVEVTLSSSSVKKDLAAFIATHVVLGILFGVLGILHIILLIMTIIKYIKRKKDETETLEERTGDRPTFGRALSRVTRVCFSFCSCI